MAYCHKCGGELAPNAAFCSQCGTKLGNATENVSPLPQFTLPVQPKKKGGTGKTVLKVVGIGCGGFVALIVLLAIIGLILGDIDEDIPAEGDANESGSAGTAATLTRTTPARAAVPTPTPTNDPTITPVPTPTPAATPSPTPTPRPTSPPAPEPIKIEMTDILREYDQNKVRANSRLRYLENGKVPVSTSGFVSGIEELYTTLTPTREKSVLSFQEELTCYYADTRVAVRLTKGQSVSVTGKIGGEGSIFGGISMYGCEFEEIDSEKNPYVPAQAIRNNVVQVLCVKQGLFSSSGYTGTGLIINPQEGTVFTVHHVVADENECDEIGVEIPGAEDRLPASVVKHCGSIDRALLRIDPEKLQALTLQPIYRAGAPAQVDQEIYFWGYGSDELRMETGIVTTHLGEFTATDAYAIKGDSGGPVFNEHGHLLGTMSRSNMSDISMYTGDECQYDADG